MDDAYPEPRPQRAGRCEPRPTWRFEGAPRRVPDTHQPDSHQPRGRALRRALCDLYRRAVAGPQPPVDRAVQRPLGDLGRARRHLGIEGSVQQALHFEPASWLLSNVYLAAELVVPVVALVYTYVRARPIYISLRNTIIAIWLIAIPVFALFPVAPPRMAGIGLGEAASRGSAIGLTGHSTISTTRTQRSRASTSEWRWRYRWPWPPPPPTLAQALALLWAPSSRWRSIATGNHYLFDVVTGALTAAVGYRLGRWVTVVGQRPAATARARCGAGAVRGRDPAGRQAWPIPESHPDSIMPTLGLPPHPAALGRPLSGGKPNAPR